MTNDRNPKFRNQWYREKCMTNFEIEDIVTLFLSYDQNQNLFTQWNDQAKGYINPKFTNQTADVRWLSMQLSSFKWQYFSGSTKFSIWFESENLMYHSSGRCNFKYIVDKVFQIKNANLQVKLIPRKQKCRVFLYGITVPGPVPEDHIPPMVYRST